MKTKYTELFFAFLCTYILCDLSQTALASVTFRIYFRPAECESNLKDASGDTIDSVAADQESVSNLKSARNFEMTPEMLHPFIQLHTKINKLNLEKNNLLKQRALTRRNIELYSKNYPVYKQQSKLGISLDPDLDFKSLQLEENRMNFYLGINEKDYLKTRQDFEEKFFEHLLPLGSAFEAALNEYDSLVAQEKALKEEEKQRSFFSRPIKKIYQEITHTLEKQSERQDLIEKIQKQKEFWIKQFESQLVGYLEDHYSFDVQKDNLNLPETEEEFF